MLKGNITTKRDANKIIKATTRRKISESECQVPPGPSLHGSQKVEKAGA